MATVFDRLQELKEREEKEKAQGGPKSVEKQHQAGKLTARERLDLLFDPGSFCELDMFIRHRCSDFDMQDAFIAGEGVVTGHGTVNGRPVCAYSQDFTSRGGTLGEMHAKKICKVMDLAMKMGVPVVGFNDSGGARIQEGVDALSGYGSIFFRNSCASGVIPQISAIMGPTAGGAVYSPAMTDWLFMVEKTSYMFITGPDVIKTVSGEEIDFEGLGGAAVHNSKSGVAHFACQSDTHAVEMIKALLSYLPPNNMEDPPLLDTSDDPNRTATNLDTIVPDSARQSYDMKDVIRSIVDNGTILEPHSAYAENMIICFARMNGRTVGIIANQPLFISGSLDVDASDKATRFIRFCDAFNIPLLTLVDVPGYLPGTDQEWSGIIRHGAKLLWCYSEATVPKITMIVRKAYGGAYLAMCAKELGADMVFAWPTAEIAVMGAEGAAKIIHRREISEAADPKAKQQEKIEEYRGLFYNPYIAAARGLVDEVIMPNESRPKIIAALEFLSSKRETRPPKKHGNIPV
ncbi:MAG TPA: methylmalonyl-CoA carboxyltransferase [Dehalococcoidia bacterium]|nr:methylmalonyl-CoA carboxyltransferase [Dehalococcoidia bacterium]